MILLSYILFIIGIFCLGAVMGIILSKCKKPHVEQSVERLITAVEEAPSFAETYKARTIKRPSVDKLADKRKPKRLKETEQAMEETLDQIV